MSASADSFDVDISKAGEMGNNFIQELGKLRELDPIHWSEASHCWLVTRHGDISDALDGKYPLSLKRLIQIAFGDSEVDELMKRYPTMMQYLPNSIIDVDAPVHTRLRKLLVKSFNRKVVENVRPFVRQRINTLMDKMKENPQLEFNEEIARELPGTVILKLLGISQNYYPRLRAWANALNEGIGVPFADDAALKKADDAMADMNVVLSEEIDKHKRDPQEDLLTAMINATEDGDTMTLDEMLGSLHIVIVAGHDTTSNTMSLGLAALSQHPDFWDYMYRNPDKIAECSQEIMRYIAMSTSQARIVAEDFEWHGKKLKKGDLLFVVLAAGNRDKEVFSEPEQLDPHRNNEKSLVFAPGIHHCIGHLLAKMQVTEFFSALVTNFEGAELLDDSLDFMPQVAFRGIYKMNVRLHPRQ